MRGINLERVSFLIVDDNRYMRLIISNILRGFGVRNIAEAKDGSEAFQEMRANPVDMVICDWLMDPLDGLDFTRLVRTAEDSANPHIPIILMTAYTEMYRIFEARDAGVTEILAKPVSSKDLYLRIKASIVSPRPFIKTRTFYGPDRRRRKGLFEGSERRAPAEDTTSQLSQDDISQLFD